jgi:hypothetical protein
MHRWNRKLDAPPFSSEWRRSGFWISVGSVGLLATSVFGVGTVSASASPDHAVTVPCAGSGGGAAGLVAAIKTANADRGGTIALAKSCSYTLLGPDNPTDGGNGLPVITAPITIVGQEGTTIARASLPSSADFRVFEVAKGATLTLDSVTVTGGHVDTDGGAMFVNGGTADLKSSTVSNSTARSGGGMYVDGGRLEISGGKIDENTASGSGLQGGGGIGATDGADVTLTGTQVTTNTAAYFGGGIRIVGGATVGVRSSKIAQNVSDGNDGGVSDGFGGTGALTLIDSQVSQNRAFDSGGIGVAQGSTATVKSTEVSGNAAAGTDGIAEGGGIDNSGTLVLDHGQISDNTATGPTADGAGVQNQPTGKISAIDSQFTGNTANGTIADGGGIFNDDGGRVTLTGSTVEHNTAKGTTVAGGGVFANGTTTLATTRVSDNLPDNCSPPGRVKDCGSN